MKGIGSYVITGALALLAALAVAQGEPGVAEVHFARAATEAPAFITTDWLLPSGP